MKKREFTEEERKMLSNNPCVYSVGKVSVFYTDEFKQKALKEYLNGKSAKQIFIDAGIDLDVIGERNAVYNLGEWRKNAKIAPKRMERYRNLKDAYDKIAYLEAENEFLKKLEALEKQYR